MTLAQVPRGQQIRIARVGGSRAFRRRLMELGLVPGTAVEIVGVAPLGDPVELLVRGCSLSIRRREAAEVSVEPRIQPHASHEPHAVCSACPQARGDLWTPR
ncbi:MAG: ferrous iron transport protein A [Deltaproteobacteria bacterium]|nr:ferrous iron transport protein A [Deltaproteobacteria bacterium]